MGVLRIFFLNGDGRIPVGVYYRNAVRVAADAVFEVVHEMFSWEKVSILFSNLYVKVEGYRITLF